MPGRRDFLRKTAVAGTTAFAVPMILTVDPADAQAVTSPPPEPPGNPGPPPGGVNPPAGSPGGSGSTATGTLGGGSGAPTSRRSTAHRGELPRTGADLDRLTAAGLAATAGGAALVLWSADRKAKLAPTPAAPEPAGPDPAT
jgi:hypothetical protein